MNFLQPGIESLSTPILLLMRKGVTAFQNVRLLKWCAEYGIHVFWNVIYGFWGELPEEYARLARLTPSSAPGAADALPPGDSPVQPLPRPARRLRPRGARPAAVAPAGLSGGRHDARRARLQLRLPARGRPRPRDLRGPAARGDRSLGTSRTPPATARSATGEARDSSSTTAGPTSSPPTTRSASARPGCSWRARTERPRPRRARRWARRRRRTSTWTTSRSSWTSWRAPGSCTRRVVGTSRWPYPRGCPNTSEPRPQAIFTAAAFSRPSAFTLSSRIRNFCTLPVTVIGKASTKRT